MSVSEEIRQKIEDHRERTMDAWYNGLAPGRVLEQVVQSQDVEVLRLTLPSGLISAYEPTQNQVLIHSDLAGRTYLNTRWLSGQEVELVCREWHNLRVHRKTGEAPKHSSKAFLEACCQEWLLPRELLEQHGSYRFLENSRGEHRHLSFSEISEEIDALAEYFAVTPRFVRHSLQSRGVLETEGLRLKLGRSLWHEEFDHIGRWEGALLREN